VVHNLQPGIGDICADPTGLQVKREDEGIDIYSHVHFSVIEGGKRMSRGGFEAVPSGSNMRYMPPNVGRATLWLRCRDGKGEFVPGEQVTQEIQLDERTTSGQISLWLSYADTHATGYRKAAV
jgi:hypothetical protein